MGAVPVANGPVTAAALAARGSDPKTDMLAQLLAFDLGGTAQIRRVDPVIAPGPPPGFPGPDTLVPEDCIQPHIA